MPKLSVYKNNHFLPWKSNIWFARQRIMLLKFNARFYTALRTELKEIMKEQGQDVPSRIKALKDRKKVIESKMDSLEDQMIAKTIPQERIDKKYIPLRDELKSIEADLVKLKKPSANLTDKKIETIIKFLRELPKLYKAFNKKEKKQFLRWFVEKVWIKNKKLDGFDHTEPFKVLTDLRLVRITDLWLPLKDLFCNHKLEFDISLNDLKIAFDEMGLKQPRLAFATSA